MKNIILITIISLFVFSANAQDSLKTIESSISQIVPQGVQSVIVVNRGSAYGLKNGDKGKLTDEDGTVVTITEVRPVSARAIVAIPANKIDREKMKVIFKVPVQ